MSLLPGRILPATETFGRADKDGNVTIAKNWWLLLYNICLQTVSAQGGGGGTPSVPSVEVITVDPDVVDADATSLRQQLANLGVQSESVASATSEYPDIARALFLAQDCSLPDCAPLAQPAVSIAVGASPFTFTAPFSGSVAVSGGTVSALAIVRQGVSVPTGVTAGVLAVSRFDAVTVTYSAAPTVVYLPT